MFFFLEDDFEINKINFGVLIYYMVKWFNKRKFIRKIFNFIFGFRNTIGCKLGWVLEFRSWCKGRSWIIWLLGCLNRFILFGFLIGCKIIRCFWSCVFGIGLRVGEFCCIGINNNRGLGRFIVLGEICEVVIGIWGVFFEK